MKNRKDILIIVALFAALIAFIVFGPVRRTVPSQQPSATTHSSNDEGALAFYNWLHDMGYDSRRLEYRDFTLDDADAALVILNPSESINRVHSRTILDWVEQGGTLIFADDRSRLFSPTNALLADLNITTDVYTNTLAIEPAQPIQPVFDQPSTGTLQVQTSSVLVIERDDFVPLVGTHDTVLVAGLKYGSGYIYLSATTFPFTNAGLHNNENAALVLNMLRRVPSGGRVQFDEYHHGYFTPPSPSTVVMSSPWGWAMVYALVVCALYMILSGRRFGRPIPLKEEVTRRSSAEYVESMADLFQRGGKRGYILQHYHDTFKRRIARRDGVNPQLEDTEFVRELARTRQIDESALLALLARLRSQSPSETDLVQIVSMADDVSSAFMRHR